MLTAQELKQIELTLDHASYADQYGFAVGVDDVKKILANYVAETVAPQTSNTSGYVEIIGSAGRTKL